MDNYGSYGITDEQWKRIQPLLPPEYTAKKGRPRKDNWTMLNSMLWMNRSTMEATSRALWPLYARFAKWRDDGIWEKIFKELNQDADTENLSIDSTCVKVHESSNGGEKAESKAVGRTKGGLNTKIHTIVDGLGGRPKICVNLHSGVE